METTDIELTWLDERETITVSELSRVCALSAEELDELVDYGALLPLREVRHERLFSADCVMPLRSAGRLRRDFDLDLFAVALLLEHLRRIDVLERQVRALEARVPTGARLL
jgi:chaperone modulatory protein CbpM